VSGPALHVYITPFIYEQVSGRRRQIFFWGLTSLELSSPPSFLSCGWMASVPPCPRGCLRAAPEVQAAPAPQPLPVAPSSLVGGWPQCLPSAAQAPPYPPSTRGPQAFSGATAHSRAAAKHTHRRHLPARPCAPFFLPRLPFASCPVPTPRPVFLFCGWMASMSPFRPLITPHLTPFPPASPCLPPRADTRHPPGWPGR